MDPVDPDPDSGPDPQHCSKPNQVFTPCLPGPSWTFLILPIQSLRCVNVINLTVLLDLKVAKWTLNL
jgi:hypothetical protein